MNSTILLTSFEPLLLPFFCGFTEPSGNSFRTLAAAWLLSCGRRTVTNLVRTLGPDATKSHDAYQYFFSGAVWAPEEIWRILFETILSCGLIPTDAVVELSGDDTLMHHSGRKIFGVGVFRDAVRSSRKHVAYACGHNWVILCWIVPVPFCGGVRLALPINARLRPKVAKTEGRSKKSTAQVTTVELLREMVAEVASWVPKRRFRLLADGAYASLAGDLPANVSLISRLRKDAALYEPPPARRSRHAGRPPKKGRRLPTPAQRARAPRLKWKRKTLTLYGQRRDVLLHNYEALWYEVRPDQMIRIVIVRDPDRKSDDEFFFSTDRNLTVQQIVEGYGRRWSQEVTHRELKQEMGIEDPQARVESAVRRQAPFCMVLLSLTKLWYVRIGRRDDPLLAQRDAWYTHKEGIAFRDMLGALRYGSWRARILSGSGLRGRRLEIVRSLLSTLAKAS